MRCMNVVRLVGVLTVMMAAGSAAAQSKTFAVEGGGASKIQFVSDATLEKITGSAAKIVGNVTVDPNALKQAKGEIAVAVASLTTNLELRDEHLHGENWLDAAHFPEAKLVITEVSGADKLKPDEVVETTIKAKFTLHGVTRDVLTKAKVRWIVAKAGAKDALHVLASFPVHLEDYNVSIPSIVALKVARDIMVNVDLRATAQ